MKLQRTNRLRTPALGAVAVLGSLFLSACGSDDNTGQDGGAGGVPTAHAGDVDCAGEGSRLLASGSSAQKHAMEVWIKQYTAACETQINYRPVGSGAGIQEFLQGKTGFAGSDSVLDEEEVNRSLEVCRDGGKGINLPMVGGPVAVGYHLPGVDSLVLDAPTIAAIFDSEITEWDDEAIKELNPGTDLPSTKIQAFHRSDESGTTDNFTTYLHTAAPEQWPYEPAKAWAGRGGQAADGSSGVSSQVKQVRGAIGYFELSYAQGNDIPTVKIDTGASEPVEATVQNSSEGIAAARITGQGKDLALRLDYTTAGEGAYPLIMVTYEIVCDRGNNPATLDATKSFLGYAASESGQQALTELGYAPMPEEIIRKVRRTVDSLG